MSQVTWDTEPTPMQYFLWKLNKRSKERKEAKRIKQGTRTLTPITALMRLVLNVAGFGFLTFAGFWWNILAGLVVAGLSCFALSWLTTTSDTDTTDDSNTPQRTQR